MKVLFLYSELAGYFIACLEALAKRPGVEIHLVHWPVNAEAPFDFSFPENIKLYRRKEFDRKQLMELAEKTSPDIIFCSGWVDKEYLKVCEGFRNKIPVIVGFDNKWKGTLKQKVGSLLSKKLIHTYFTHAWIPGRPQLSYAQRLKFKDKNILTGFYSCDYDLFHDLYLKNTESKKKKFPHRFIFAGRYYGFKGIQDLWKAFIDLQKEEPNGWELWCLGTGDVKPIAHPQIKHFGFVQSGEISNFISEGGVFVLPSRIEPWGVAVHEFAAAGFPLICSNEVGAADLFLKEGQNGFSFKAGSVSGLKSSLKKIISCSDQQLYVMSEKSAGLGAQITPEKWTDTLMSVVNKTKP